MMNEGADSGQEAGEGPGWQHWRREQRIYGGTHVIGQPGITAGREAQGTQTSLERSSDSMTRQQGTLSWME